MIFRKPYAFLIKNFKKIHIFLLVLAAYIIFEVSKTRNFVKEVIAFGTYDVYTEPITKYINIIFILALIITVVLFIVLIFLLRKKNKPWKLYLISFASYLVTLIISLIVINIFSTYDGGSSIGIRSASDLLLISSLLQMPTFVIVIIRILGIDLNKFNFKVDEEYLELDSNDLDEFEININVDKNSFKRGYKRLLRNLNYIYQEHKFIARTILTALILITFAFSYKYFFIDHKSYKEGDVFNTNGYTLKVNNVYFTDKDKSGNVISKNSNFVVVDLNIRNNYMKRTINFNRFHIMNGIKNYSTTYNVYGSEFADLGKTYEKKELQQGESFNPIIVFKVDKKLNKNKFVLYYQELDSKNPYLRKIKINIKDLSEIKDNNILNIGDDMEFNLGSKKENILIDNVELGNTFTYSLQDCTNASGCRTTKEGFSVTSEYRILKISFVSEEFEGQELIDFSSKYGKINYIDDKGKVVSVNIINAVNKKYSGKYMYLKVPSNIETSNDIKIVYTIRNNKYIYKIK